MASMPRTASVRRRMGDLAVEGRNAGDRGGSATVALSMRRTGCAYNRDRPHRRVRESLYWRRDARRYGPSATGARQHIETRVLEERGHGLRERLPPIVQGT